ncbi:hypothetical protein Dimus_005405, partial [Dionaea muscipula]
MNSTITEPYITCSFVTTSRPPRAHLLPSTTTNLSPCNLTACPSLCRHYLHHRSPRTGHPSLPTGRPSFLPTPSPPSTTEEVTVSVSYIPTTEEHTTTTTSHLPSSTCSPTPFTADTRPPHFTITITACPSRDTSSPAAAAIADDRQGEEQQHAAAVLNRSLPPFSRRRRRYFIKGVEIEAKLRVIGSW